MAHPDHGGSPAAFRRCLGALRVASAGGAEVSGGAEVEPSHSPHVRGFLAARGTTRRNS